MKFSKVKRARKIGFLNRNRSIIKSRMKKGRKRLTLV